MTHLTDDASIKGRWIQPRSEIYQFFQLILPSMFCWHKYLQFFRRQTKSNWLQERCCWWNRSFVRCHQRDVWSWIRRQLAFLLAWLKKVQSKKNGQNESTEEFYYNVESGFEKNIFLIIKQACSPIIYHAVKKVHFSAKNPSREELQLMIFLYLSF